MAELKKPKKLASLERLTGDELRRLRALRASEGLERAAAFVGVSEVTLEGALGGNRIKPDTAERIRAALAATLGDDDDSVVMTLTVLGQEWTGPVKLPTDPALRVQVLALAAEQRAPRRAAGKIPTTTLWLDPIPTVLREQAAQAFERGDAEGFLGFASNEHGLDLVLRNRKALATRRIYEAALLTAYMMTRTNNSHWPDRKLVGLFQATDRDKLRALGDKLPGRGPYVLYRGVSGEGARRHVRGLAWTSDLDSARWFADRFANLGAPAVYTATVPRSAVFAYLHEKGREEHEFIVALPHSVKPVRVERRGDKPGRAGTAAKTKKKKKKR